jgi:hypothetical protein
MVIEKQEKRSDSVVVDEALGLVWVLLTEQLER